MATKRTRVTRNQETQLTPELIEAWREKNYSKVSQLLRLKPWECDPTWCKGLWQGKYGPCSDEPARGCHQAVQWRDALNKAVENEL